MKLFFYCKTGHQGIGKYIHNVGGPIIVSSEDPDGGVIAVVHNATYATFPQDPDIIPLSFDHDEELPDEIIQYLGKHPKHGIKKGDTLSQALKKVRAASENSPYFLLH